MSFYEKWQQESWENIQLTIYSKSAMDVENALNAPRVEHEDFLALLSPAAAPYLEAMAMKSQQLTRQRFGNTISMFIPLYLSNLCANECSYCGFSMSNRIKRKPLASLKLNASVRPSKPKAMTRCWWLRESTKPRSGWPISKRQWQ